MKEIKAYVRNNMVNKVIDALAQLPEPPSVAAVPLETYGHGVIDDAYGRLRMTKLEVDIADASYAIELPEWLRVYFGLGPCSPPET